MKTLMFASSLAALSVLACAAPSQPATAAAQDGDVRWTVEPDTGKGGEPRLRLRHDKSSSDISLDDVTGAKRPEFAAARRALGGSGAVTFSVRHDSGSLDCSGSLARAYSGEGRCRFTPDAAFERGLADRGLTSGRRRDMVAMLMVDATLELADGLTREGVRPDDVDDLIAAAALGVTGDYVRDLKSAPMRLTKIDEAIACRALGVDGPYVRELVAAGYDRLDADDVVGMKAMGVTGAYAREMNRLAEKSR